jgi:hypothetical protein
VGKTRLVTEVASERGEQGFTVVLGRCVRFAAEASSYLPIAQALGPQCREILRKLAQVPMRFMAFSFGVSITSPTMALERRGPA